MIEKFSRLPPYLSIEGVEFQLQLIINGRPDDVRLVYKVVRAARSSKHYGMLRENGCWMNPFGGGRLQGFLYLVENIATDEDFVQACEDCYEFLKKNDLLDI